MKENVLVLVSFKVSNFKSILEPVYLNMLADPDDQALMQNLYEINGVGEKVNSFSVIMGANGSGKSSIVDAFIFVRDIALREPINTIPRNRLAREELSSDFEVCFFDRIWDSLRKYTLSISPSGTVREIFYEFENEGWEEKINYVFSMKEKDDGLPKNVLNVDWVNERYSLLVFEEEEHPYNSFFKSIMYFNSIESDIDLCHVEDLEIIDGITTPDGERRSLTRIDYTNNQDIFKSSLVNLLNNFGIGVIDIEFENLGSISHHVESTGNIFYTSSRMSYEAQEITDRVLERAVKESQEFFDEKNPDDYTSYDPADYVRSNIYCVKALIYPNYSVSVEEESSGTKRLLKLAFELVRLSYSGETLLVLDEMGAGLHDTLATEIVRQYFELCKKGHKGTSQLIVTSHNTVLLRDIPLRKDQLWFTEMKENRTTDLFCLAELKGVKSSENFEENYLRGKYGALPPKREWMKEPDEDD